MTEERLASLLARLADEDEDAREELLTHILLQPLGIQVLALEALEDGGDKTYEQLVLTLVDDPNLVTYAPRGRQPVTDHDALEKLHLIAQMAEREWHEATGARHQPPQTLLAELNSSARQSQIQAARQLVEYPHSETIKALIDVIGCGDKQVAGAAVESLQALGTMTIPFLVEALSASDSQVRWHVAKALSTMADEQAVPALIIALEDKHYGTRWLAAEGLVHAGDTTIVPLLRRLTEKGISAWLRQGAWHVFKKLDLPEERERQHYKQVAAEIRRRSAATIPNLAREELQRVGVM